MAKPVILAVDDDPQVLRAVARDLRQAYGDTYRIVRADSGLAALETLRELKLRNDAVALFVSDQRMPKMSGVEFLSEAMGIYPDAKRALLTAYADTEAAIKAINETKIHYYLMKPWDPPEEQLYPILNDLLDDWQAGYNPPFEGVRIVGHRWAPLSHQLRDFLARNQVPYRWLDVEGDGDAQFVLESTQASMHELPLVVFPDGSHLAKPTPLEVAEKAGLSTQASTDFYDLIIVGAGPAGLASAVYGASEGLRVMLIDSSAPGGQAGTSSRIENYLGFPVGLSGGDLARRAVAQARKFGAEIIAPQQVAKLRLEDPYRIITLTEGSELSCHALVIATGVSYRKLNVPGMDQLTGAGVYYGASMSEAMSCRNEDVYIIGAGNSAGQAAMYLAKFAKRVFILVRGDNLGAKMSQYLVDQIEATDNISVMLNTEVNEVSGEERLETITLLDNQTDNTETVPASTLFIFIGASPHTDWLEGLVVRDKRGFVLTGTDLLRDGKSPKGFHQRMPFLLETSVPGIFAAGDVRHGSVKRVASAVGEGSIAVQFIHQYLAEVGA